MFNKKGPTRFTSPIIRASAVTLFLHFAWEKFQCSPYFIHGAVPGSESFPMIRAALGDLLITWTAYLGVVVVSRSWDWVIKTWSLKQWAAIFGQALIFSFSIEILALRTARWSYTANNSLIPIIDVSALPVLQLLILFPLSFFILRLMIKKSLRENSL